MRHQNSIEEEERLYSKGRELAAKLKIPFPELMLKVWLVRGEEKEVIIDRHARSPVRNFYNACMYNFFGLNINTGLYQDGSWRQRQTAGGYCTLGQPFAYNGTYNRETTGYFTTAGQNGFGIQVGTGTTGESIDDYTVETLIYHDSSPPTAGRMQYSAVTLSEGFEAGGPYYWSLAERVFDNNSGGTIAVTETTCLYNVNGVPNIIMFARDVFSAVNVANTETIGVSYEWRVSFP